MVLLAFATINTFAQAEKRVFVSNNFNNNTDKTIYIKWFLKGAVQKEGVNLYRKTNNGNWLKVNNQPITIKPEISEVLKENTLAETYYSAFKNYDVENIEGRAFIVVNTLALAIYNNDFAETMGMQYQDTQVSFGEKVTYKVVVIKNNIETEAFESAEHISEPYKKGEPPNQINIVREKKAIKIGWTPENNRYFSVVINRWRPDNNRKKSVSTAPVHVRPNSDGKFSEFHFNDAEFNKDSAYYYQLTPMDYFGNELTPSQPILVDVKDFDPPFEAFNLSSNQNKQVNKIKWEALLEDDRAGFDIYRSTNSDTGFKKINKILIPDTARFYLDTISIPGDFFYTVNAVDASGNSSQSELLISNVKDLDPPKTPINFSIEADTGVFKFTWSQNTENDLAGYYIYKAPIKSQNFVVLNPKPLKSNSFKEKIPKNNRTKFKYAVLAADTNYNRSELSEIIIAQLPDVIPPQKPVINDISKGESSISVGWIKSLDDDLMFYQINRFNTQDSTNTILANNISPFDSTFVDETLAAGVFYQYQVFAIDSSNNFSMGSTPYQVKIEPANKTVQIKKFELRYNKSKNAVNLFWELENLDSYYSAIITKKIDGIFKQISPSLKSETDFNDKIKETEYPEYQLIIYDNKGNKILSEIKTISK